MQLVVKFILHKFIVWSHKVGIVINIKIVGRKLLQSFAGRLATVAVVVHVRVCFLNNIIGVYIKSFKKQHANHIPNQVKWDPKIWNKIL